jgi:hypothetical protein
MMTTANTRARRRSNGNCNIKAVLFASVMNRRQHLLLVLLLIICVDDEVAKLVRVLIGGNDVQPITEVVLLEVLLGKVLQVSLGEWRLCCDLDLGLVLGDSDTILQDTGLTVDLDLLGQELLL